MKTCLQGPVNKKMRFLNFRNEISEISEALPYKFKSFADPFVFRRKEIRSCKT